MPVVEGGAGLVPGAVNSVAPSGMPVDPTDVLGPVAREDVALSGDMPVPPTCAKEAPQPRSDAARVAIMKRIFMASTFLLEF